MKKKGNLFVQKDIDDNSVIATYLISTNLDPEFAAIKLCKEQSLSNSIGYNLETLKKYSARYIQKSIRKLNKNQFLADIAFPSENCENSLSMALSAVGGDTFNIKDLRPVKILSVKLPESIIKHYEGPKYGVDGLRKKLNCYSRPILCGPVKPCVGLNPKEFAKRAKEALLGGADIVKDDELICNPSYNSLKVRVKAVSKVIEEAEKITGEKKMYFAFIGSGSPSKIMENAKTAMNSGANGFMVSPAINGFEIIKDVKMEFKLPIIAHNALMYGAYTKNHGIAYSVFAYLQRLCGADIVICPAPYGTFEVMPREDHFENISALLSDLGGIKKSFPGFCGGQSPKTALKLRKDVGSNDFVIITGTSLYDHPEGPETGARLIRKSFYLANFQQA